MDRKNYKGIADAFLKVILRSLPIVPAPELYDLILSVRRSETDLDNQVREAFDALTKSSALIENLGRILREREQKLTSLQQEYHRISELSKMTSAQADAVASELRNALGASATRERLFSFAINILAGLIIFVVGVFASPWIKAHRGCGTGISRPICQAISLGGDFGRRLERRASG